MVGHACPPAKLKRSRRLLLPGNFGNMETFGLPSVSEESGTC